MHDFEWRETDQALTIHCLLPAGRRRFLALFLLAPLLWLGPFLLLCWLIGGGIPFRDVWLFQNLFSDPETSRAFVAVNLVCALPLAWQIGQLTLFTPETTLHFDKRAQRLTINQKAPAVPPRVLSIPFDTIQGVSAELWKRTRDDGEQSAGQERWFLEIRFRDGRRFRTPASLNRQVLESCALRIRNGTLTTRTVGVPRPPQRDKASVRILWGWIVLSSIAFLWISGRDWSNQVLHQRGSLAMARLQQRSAANEKSVELRYTFALPSGGEVDASRRVDPNLAATVKEGDWMAVRYASAHPEHNVLSMERTNPAKEALMINFGFLLFLAAVLGDALAATSPGKPWRLGPQDGWC